MEKVLILTAKKPSAVSNIELPLPEPRTDVWVVWGGKYFLPAVVKLQGEIEEE